MAYLILVCGLLAPAFFWGRRCIKQGRKNFHEEIAILILLAAIPLGAGIYYGADAKEKELLSEYRR